MHYIYLDHAASTPIDKEVLEAMRPYWQEDFYNPSAIYEPARQVRAALDTARHEVAQVLGAKPTEIIFTAGATESVNLALGGALSQFPGKKTVVSAIEHDAVLKAASAFGERIVLPVKPDGMVDLVDLETAVDDDTVLISIGYVNNEIGTVQALAKISKIVADINRVRVRDGNNLPLYFHTDATQAPLYFDLQARRLGVDLMTLNGSKIYGPKQSGILYVKSGVKLRPLIHGGGQERGLRSGTENVAYAIGFAKALTMAAAARHKEQISQLKLREMLIDGLLMIPDSLLNGGRQHRTPANVNISFKGVSGETLVHYLDKEGILVATGSACSANDDTPSHVLVALGLDKETINGSLRLTLGRMTTEKEVQTVIQVLGETVEHLRQRG